ncbi:MAG: cobalamin B12-binding domain-containing protein [Bacteroidetes bacterium]|nr:cobalamin B12-binding domain-containing protein [Bacteroidota bacterium]
MSHSKIQPYKPKNKLRIVTAASLFDGHDSAINIMRRILQASGAEVIHLGHNRSVQEVVDCAIQEDAQAIAMTSYQGGHIEYLKYMVDLLKEKGAGHIKIFAGGGGTILPEEIKELEAYGITRIYSPDDGREMGLQGMINDLLQKSDFSTLHNGHAATLRTNGNTLSIVNDKPKAIAGLISLAESFPESFIEAHKQIEIIIKNKMKTNIGIKSNFVSGYGSIMLISSSSKSSSKLGNKIKSRT